MDAQTMKQEMAYLRQQGAVMQAEEEIFQNPKTTREEKIDLLAKLMLRAKNLHEIEEKVQSNPENWQ